MKTRDLVLVALFAAIVAALGLLPPLTLGFIPVPITAQTLGVMLAGSILGAKRGALSLLVFTVLVSAGLPLLAGGNGGLVVFAGPSGGFFAGFTPAAWVIGFLVERTWARLNFLRAFAINILGGVVVLYALGIPWLAFTLGAPLWQAAAGSAVFIPGDLLKAAIAASLALTLRRAYPLVPVAERTGPN